MPIDRADFQTVSQADIEELVNSQVPESLRIEYKRDLYGQTDADKKELLKDVSAFANAYGGHLIVGLDDQNGLPAVVPIQSVNPDADVLRITQTLRTGIEPRIIGLQVRPVPILGVGYCLAVRIPQSWNAPHRVCFQNWNRFFIRHSAGVHEASLEELRTMFNQSSDAMERARAMHRERTELATALVGPLLVKPVGRLVLHLVPLASVTSGQQRIDLESAFQRANYFLPVGSDAYNISINFEGLSLRRQGEENYGYTQIFRNGGIEATKGGLVSTNDHGDRWIDGAKLEDQVLARLPRYIEGLRQLEVAPPFLVLMTLEGAKDAVYRIPANLGLQGSAIDQAALQLPECIISDDFDFAACSRAVRPIFDALWNSAGHFRALTFNDDGIWTGGAAQSPQGPHQFRDRGGAGRRMAATRAHRRGAMDRRS